MGRVKNLERKNSNREAEWVAACAGQYEIVRRGGCLEYQVSPCPDYTTKVGDKDKSWYFPQFPSCTYVFKLSFQVQIWHIFYLQHGGASITVTTFHIVIQG